jgi:hypothetical protein
VLKCIERLLDGQATLRCSLPSTGRVTLTRQAKRGRYVLHLLYANTVARGGQFSTIGDTASSRGYTIEVVEDLVPLRNVTVKLALGEQIRRATLQPQGEEIPIESKDGRITFTVDDLTCHQMVVLDYGK